MITDYTDNAPRLTLLHNFLEIFLSLLYLSRCIEFNKIFCLHSVRIYFEMRVSREQRILPVNGFESKDQVRKRFVWQFTIHIISMNWGIIIND